MMNTADKTVEKIDEIVPQLMLLTLSKPVDGSKYKKIKIRRTESCFFAEKFTATQVFHEKFDESTLKVFLREQIAKVFKNAVATTQTGSVTFLSNKKGKTTILENHVSKQNNPPMAKIEGAAFSLNRQKNYIIREGAPVEYLVKLGVMTRDGKVHAKYYDKFRQVNRFLEFVADILPEVAPLRNASKTEGSILKIVDFGCGKSYLTFALYHYLTEICKISAEITGIDLKSDVIADCAKLADACGYSGLRFFCGDVEQWSKENRATQSPDIVISLRACDTATDHALNFAIDTGAKAILSVPCCQHELNTALSDATTRKNAAPQLQALLKHGIIRDKFCALATDCLRAEILEQCGYKVQLLEFIDIEHTPKNVLIRALKKQTATLSAPSNDFTALKNALGTPLTLSTLRKG